MSKQIRFGEPIEPDIPIEDLPPEALLTTASRQRNQLPFQVYMMEQVYEHIWNHVKKTTDIESGGVLVGHAFQTPDEQITFVIIVAAIAQHSDNRSVGHFTVGPPEIAVARAEMEKRYPGLVAVGWYHSHPGHGIFLSGQDMTIVRSIYNLPWHIALVVDPKNEREGIFVGPHGEQIGGKSNDGLRTSWLGLKAVPDSVKAIALYNQWQEGQDTLGELQELVRQSHQLRHWHNNYRDVDKVQNRENSLTAPSRLLSAISSASQSMPAPSPPEPARGAAKAIGTWLWFSLVATVFLVVFFCSVALRIPELGAHPIILLIGFIFSLAAVGMAWYATSLGGSNAIGAINTKLSLGSQISRFGAPGLLTLVIMSWCGFFFYVNTLEHQFLIEIPLLNTATTTVTVTSTQTMTPIPTNTATPAPTHTDTPTTTPTNTPMLPTPTFKIVPTSTVTSLPEPTQEVFQPIDPITAPIQLEGTEVLTPPEILTGTTPITTSNVFTDTQLP